MAQVCCMCHTIPPCFLYLLTSLLTSLHIRYSNLLLPPPPHSSPPSPSSERLPHSCYAMTVTLSLKQVPVKVRRRLPAPSPAHPRPCPMLQWTTKPCGTPPSDARYSASPSCTAAWRDPPLRDWPRRLLVEESCHCSQLVVSLRPKRQVHIRKRIRSSRHSL